MRYATFITDVKEEKKILLPLEICEKLRIEPGDRLEVSVKKIKSGKLDLMLSENPLYRLLDLPRANSGNAGGEK